MDITIVILTFNELDNIEECVKSVLGLDSRVVVVDSGSTDGTVEFLKEAGVEVFYNRFDNYSQQRNWSFNNVDIKTEWVLNLDADHRLTPELVEEIKFLFAKGFSPEINGFLASRRTIFLDRWIRYGGQYPTYHAILFRKGKGFCENKLYDQHFVIDGKTSILKNDILDVFNESLSDFIVKHNKWSNLEAEYRFNRLSNTKILGEIKPRIFGTAIERRRYLKMVFEKFPLFVGAVCYYFYRYFLRLGFLDGKEGFIFHFLQCFWFRIIVDSKIIERELKNKVNK
jgi:glycosyltransferase involved in cell wall biosynthesis